MQKQLIQAVLNLGVRTFSRQQSPSLTTQLRHPERTYSAYRRKRELDSENVSSSKQIDDVKQHQDQSSELSLMAKKMLRESDSNKEAKARKDTKQITRRSINKNQESKDFRSRMEALATDIDDAIFDLEVDAGSKGKATPSASDIGSVWPHQVIHDESVESITFTDDIESTLKSKPSILIGTEDPNTPPSQIPCVGCGALLQCQHNTFPGFIPSEYYKLLTEKEIRTSKCQRCYYIQHCDAFAEVSTHPDEFVKMISQIRPTKSAVVMVVDLMDIHGSIVPSLMKYIGYKHPLIIVGNKADLLAPDDPEYLKQVRKQLEDVCRSAGLRNIRNCVLVSAKTGFGIERLITTLFALYKHKVDVFIVGTANAGKSSLFNILLASDYCKHSARDLIERATISVWPGTTLNLLKFPIMRPSYRTVALRQIRLKQEKALEKERRKLQEARRKEKGKNLTWELKDTVTATDVRTDNQKVTDETGNAWGQEIIGYKGAVDGSVKPVNYKREPVPFEPEEFSDSYWTYDTPGIINPEQIMNLSTPEETPFLSPVSMVIPRCLIFKPGETAFLSGLSRLDFVEGERPVILTVHSGPDLPIHVVATQDADRFYEENIGTDKLGIPLGNAERLQRLPSLIGREFTIQGEFKEVAAADIQLSSLGWISVALGTAREVTLRAYTPGRKGMYLRVPALMPQYTVYKGKHIRGTPFYQTSPPGWIMARNFIDRVDDS